jgi:hypothetical protein
MLFVEAQQKVARIGYLTTRPAALDSDRKQRFAAHCKPRLQRRTEYSMEHRSAEGEQSASLAAERI